MPAAGDIGLCGKVSMGLYGKISKNELQLEPAVTRKLYFLVQIAD
jgi:hypothetical protein